MTALNEPNAILKNLNIIAEQFGDSQLISVSFFDHGFNEIVSLLSVRGGLVHSIDETVSDVVKIIDSIYDNSTDVGGIALVILNSDGERASELGHVMTFHPAFEKYPLIAVLYTDGFRWRDVVSNDGGETDNSEITDFQLRSIVDGDAVTEYEPLSPRPARD